MPPMNCNNNDDHGDNDEKVKELKQKQTKQIGAKHNNGSCALTRDRRDGGSENSSSKRAHAPSREQDETR